MMPLVYSCHLCLFRALALILNLIFPFRIVLNGHKRMTDCIWHFAVLLFISWSLLSLMCLKEKYCQETLHYNEMSMGILYQGKRQTVLYSKIFKGKFAYNYLRPSASQEKESDNFVKLEHVRNGYKCYRKICLCFVHYFSQNQGEIHSYRPFTAVFSSTLLSLPVYYLEHLWIWQPRQVTSCFFGQGPRERDS